MRSEDADSARPSVDEGGEDGERRGARVGTVLRGARLARGDALQDVSAALRIRLPYLEAIEDGRIDDLPGLTYGIGFVRAYSEYLGLDFREIVEQFKEEIVGIPIRTELQFPEPLPGNRVPGLGLLLVALFLAGGVYGGYLYTSSKDLTFVEAVEAVPGDLMALISSDSADEESEEQETTSPETPTLQSAESVPATPEVETSEVEETEIEISGAETPTQAPAQAAEATDIAEPSVPEIPIQTPRETEPVQSDIPRADSDIETTELPPPNRNDSDDSAGTPPGESPQSVESDPVIVNPSEDPEPALAVAESGASAHDPQIIIQATNEVWVRITAPGGTILIEKLMDRGEIYRVPKRAGLVMETGNAGALKILVGEVVAAPLGEIGEVRRRILLTRRGLLGESG